MKAQYQAYLTSGQEVGESESSGNQNILYKDKDFVFM